MNGTNTNEEQIITPELYDAWKTEFDELGLRVGDAIPQPVVNALREKIEAEQAKVGNDVTSVNADETTGIVIPPASVEVAQLFYRGMLIISNGYRTVENKNFRHVKCSDGTSYDLTETEYKKEVGFTKNVTA